MRIVSVSTLKSFWQKPGRKDAEQPLKAWYAEACRASWQSPNEIKVQFKNASVVGKNRVVFNISGNKYRLVVAFAYRIQTAYIKFIGTHAEYDKIDVTTIDQSS
ncbi:type II toxin-antitoxin system HigB family toxin [Orrella daihaiensis]|uniref:Type II toxin-antitoxin system HigB family toxin n=1 Tax=Orrella daihaiensis TaxID=2782176 RepID=A0ABY4AK80_9BURK|nr:type II toxin-antitoxin system HigB family toxin [Orrella daihaiensis]UOD50686.1 type II toxin-antitoxin system HigB family toxin [Orrella daihaiensis]